MAAREAWHQCRAGSGERRSAPAKQDCSGSGDRSGIPGVTTLKNTVVAAKQ